MEVICQQFRCHGLGLAEAADGAVFFAFDDAGFSIGSGAGDASPLLESRPAHMADQRQFDFTMVYASVTGSGFFVRFQRIFFPPPLVPRVSGKVVYP